MALRHSAPEVIPSPEHIWQIHAPLSCSISTDRGMEHESHSEPGSWPTVTVYVTIGVDLCE